MPKPRQRTRTKKRRLVKLPSGGGLTTHYKKRRVKASRCSQCRRIIFGAPIQIGSQNKVSLTQKRPQRMFGGQLCHVCLQTSLKRATRSTVSE